MKTFSIMILAVIVFLTQSAAGAVDISGFEYSKSLHPLKSQEKQIGSFVLDNQVFSATDNGYTNIRVLDQDNIEIPFLVKPDTTGKFIMKEYNVSMEKASFELLPDNRIEIIFKRKDSSFSPTTIEIVTKQRNFDKQATISGSNDRSKWKVLVANYPIFDYSRYFDARNTRVEFVPGNFDFYKIEIWNITETHQSPLTRIIRETKSEVLVRETEKVSFQKKDFKIDKIKFLAKKKIFVENKKIIRSYTAKNIQTINNADTKETEVVFHTARQPLISMKIVAEDSNYSRQVTT
ncbi:MAG: hypothetical protein KAV18_03130, partial [Candidatus Omnitrophica bacterium]|nr:hypothetical protein [Candidatus Omnitrophota bacterium]